MEPIKTCPPNGLGSIVNGRAIGTKEDARSVNNLLESISLQAHDARRQLIDLGKEITAEAIKNLMLGIDDRKMILEIFKEHNRQVEELIGKEYAEGTLDLFQRSLDHARRFMEWKYDVSDFDIRKLDYEFISQFSFYLKTVRNCQHNTTIKYLTYFKKIVLNCVKNGWLLRDPFANFKLTKREVERDYLTDEELDLISSKLLVSDRLTQVRDIFVFSCYTGLAYIDVQQLRRPDIVLYDKEQWVSIQRQKTSTPSRIQLLPVPLKLLAKYENHKLCQAKGTLFPILTNQKINAYLKEIADVCYDPHRFKNKQVSFIFPNDLLGKLTDIKTAYPSTLIRYLQPQVFIECYEFDEDRISLYQYEKASAKPSWIRTYKPPERLTLFSKLTNDTVIEI